MATKGHDMPASHEHFLRQAFAVAAQAREQGNHPFGAVLVHRGTVVLSAGNTVNTDGDCTRHAELNLVSAASTKFDRESLAGSTLYASTEPCAMCAGAIYWSGIGSVVFGCSAHVLARFADGSLIIPCRNVLQQGRRSVRVIGPLLEDEGAALHAGFWRNQHGR